MQGPKCKFCGEPHFGLCQKLSKSKVAATAKKQVAEIAARPVKLGPKGKAKKAKRAKKKAKQAKPAQAVETTPQNDRVVIKDSAQ